MASSTDHFNNPAGTALSLGVTVTYDQTDSAVPTTGTEGDSTSPMQGLLPDKFGAQYSVEAGPSNTAALTPNTEAILQQFLDLPTPIVEQTLNFSNQPMVEDTASGQLALYNHGDQSQVGQQHIRANGLILEPPLPMYNAPPMLPTGLNLLGPSSVPYSGNPSEMQRFLSTLTGDAVAYHLNLPANNRAKELQIGTLGEDNGSQSSSSTYVQEAICPTGLPDLAYSYIFSNEGDTPRNTKEPIEVPPFVREKLLRVYLDSQHRCPGFYVNQKRLFNRLSGTLEDRPHPSWLFSMVSRSDCHFRRIDLTTSPVPRRHSLDRRSGSPEHGSSFLLCCKGTFRSGKVEIRSSAGSHPDRHQPRVILDAKRQRRGIDHDGYARSLVRRLQGCPPHNID